MMPPARERRMIGVFAFPICGGNVSAVLPVTASASETAFSTIKPNCWPSRLIVAATPGTGRTGAPHCVSSCAGASVSVSVRQVSTNGHLRIGIGSGASVPASLAGTLAANAPHSPVPPSAEWV